MLEEKRELFLFKKKENRLLQDVFRRSFCFLLNRRCIKSHSFPQRKWPRFYSKKRKSNSYQKDFGDRFVFFWIGIVFKCTSLHETEENLFFQKIKKRKSDSYQKGLADGFLFTQKEKSTRTRNFLEIFLLPARYAVY